MGAAGDADGRIGIALIVATYPVAIVITSTGKADHLPGAHVAVATVDWIGKKTLLHILQQRLEKQISFDAFQVRGAALERLQDFVLAGGCQLGERLAVRSAAAVTIKRRQRLPVQIGRRLCALRSLLLRALYKGRTRVKPLEAAVCSGELAVDENRASGLLTSGSVLVRRNDAIGKSLDRGRFGGRKERPRAC